MSMVWHGLRIQNRPKVRGHSRIAPGIIIEAPDYQDDQEENSAVAGLVGKAQGVSGIQNGCSCCSEEHSPAPEVKVSSRIARPPGMK